MPITWSIRYKKSFSFFSRNLGAALGSPLELTVATYANSLFFKISSSFFTIINITLPLPPSYLSMRLFALIYREAALSKVRGTGLAFRHFVKKWRMARPDPLSYTIIFMLLLLLLIDYSFQTI